MWNSYICGSYGISFLWKEEHKKTQMIYCHILFILRCKRLWNSHICGSYEISFLWKEELKKIQMMYCHILFIIRCKRLWNFIFGNSYGILIFVEVMKSHFCGRRNTRRHKGCIVTSYVFWDVRDCGILFFVEVTEFSFFVEVVKSHCGWIDGVFLPFLPLNTIIFG